MPGTATVLPTAAPDVVFPLVSTVVAKPAGSVAAIVEAASFRVLVMKRARASRWLLRPSRVVPRPEEVKAPKVGSRQRNSVNTGMKAGLANQPNRPSRNPMPPELYLNLPTQQQLRQSAPRTHPSPGVASW